MGIKDAQKIQCVPKNQTTENDLLLESQWSSGFDQLGFRTHGFSSFCLTLGTMQSWKKLELF